MKLTVFWLFHGTTGLPHSRQVSYFCKKADLTGMHALCSSGLARRTPNPTGRKEMRRMNVWMKTILRQLLGSATDKPIQPGLSFTRKCLERMKAEQLTESDIADVFEHGQLRNENMLTRLYNGYEIGMSYFRDARSGNYIVTAV
jgi:hypothetical protein